MLTGDIKWGALRAADVFILPSHQENFGISVVEALACGVPVLISNKVNIWREISAQGAGLVAGDDRAGTLDLLRQWVELSGNEQNRLRAQATVCFNQTFCLTVTARNLLRNLELISGR